MTITDARHGPSAPATRRQQPAAKPPKFTAAQFTATPWSTPADKAKAANGLICLIHRGFQFTDLTKPVYDALCQYFEHIAWGDRDGFYDRWFKRLDTRADFVRLLILTCEDRADWERPDLWTDVAEALATDGAEFLGSALETAQARCRACVEEQERALYVKLHARYGGGSAPLDTLNPEAEGA